MATKKTNGKAAGKSKAKPDAKPDAKTGQPPEITPEMLEQIVAVRTALRQNYAQVVMAMSMLPRYRGQMLSDLQHLVLDPMLQDRLTFAYKAQPEGAKGEPEMAGFAIWASVSEEVDLRIREQIKGGVFPLRLKPEDWNSGDINWLLDVVSPDPKMISSVVANFSKVAPKNKDLRLHPGVARMVDPELLQKMGARNGTPQPAEAS